MEKGEKDLSVLLKKLNPILNRGSYVFCNINSLDNINLNKVLFMFKEGERNITIILEKDDAEAYRLSFSYITSWITLNVYSSLEAVGFTAAFSRALSEENISCNVIAAYFHDHIFVNEKDANRAISVLQDLIYS